MDHSRLGETLACAYEAENTAIFRIAKSKHAFPVQVPEAIGNRGPERLRNRSRNLRQKRTRQPVRFEPTDPTRLAIDEYPEADRAQTKTKSCSPDVATARA